MQELKCVAQTYAWGKSGIESSVAQLKVRACHNPKRLTRASVCNGFVLIIRCICCCHCLQEAADESFKADAGTQYAELW